MRTQKAGMKALKGKTKIARKPRKQVKGPGISASEYFGTTAGSTNKSKTAIKNTPKAVSEYFGHGSASTDAHKQDLKAAKRVVPEYTFGVADHANDPNIVSASRRR